MKKLGKKLTMFLITISGMMFSTMSLAASPMGKDPGTITGDINSQAAQEVNDFGSIILGTVSVAASVLAVIILIVLGIKYMMGSAEEKAEYKKTLLPYFLGALFVFGAGFITSIIYNMSAGLQQ